VKKPFQISEADFRFQKADFRLRRGDFRLLPPPAAALLAVVSLAGGRPQGPISARKPSASRRRRSSRWSAPEIVAQDGADKVIIDRWPAVGRQQGQPHQAAESKARAKLYGTSE